MNSIAYIIVYTAILVIVYIVFGQLAGIWVKTLAIYLYLYHSTLQWIKYRMKICMIIVNRRQVQYSVLLGFYNHNSLFKSQSQYTVIAHAIREKTAFLWLTSLQLVCCVCVEVFRHTALTLPRFREWSHKNTKQKHPIFSTFPTSMPWEFDSCMTFVFRVSP